MRCPQPSTPDSSQIPTRASPSCSARILRWRLVDRKRPLHRWQANRVRVSWFERPTMRMLQLSLRRPESVPRRLSALSSNDEFERPCGTAIFEALYQSRPLQPIVRGRSLDATLGTSSKCQSSRDWAMSTAGKSNRESIAHRLQLVPIARAAVAQRDLAALFGGLP
jgi:hypothetical protein